MLLREGQHWSRDMQPAYVALIFSVLAACAGFGIVKSWRTGVATDTFTYRRDENPILFMLVILGRVFVIAFAVAETMYALGLTGDPITALHSYMPFLPSPRRGA
jgi:hypothetical protein